MADEYIRRKRSYDSAFKLKVIEFAENSNSSYGISSRKYSMYVAIHRLNLIVVALE